MKIPGHIPGAVDYWLAAAFTEFTNGFIAGLGGGTFVGAGVGTTTATTGLGAGMSPTAQVLVAVASLVLAAAGNGIKRVIVWHNANPFPNPWPRPGSSPERDAPELPNTHGRFFP
jgi:hypothetical protein